MEKFLKPKKLNVSAGSSIGHVECPDDIGTFCSGPVQPRIGVTFLIDSDGRKFSPEWYRRFTWLEYSQKRDAAFCYACRHFAPSSLNNATFARKGYRGWKRAFGDKNKGLELHCRAATHLEAVSRWEERKQRASSQNTVKEMVSNNVYERRRYYVRAIAEVIKFIAVNELSFRGDYDNVLHRECGLFTDLHLVVVNVVTRINAIKQYYDHVSLIYSFFQKIKAAENYEGSSIKRVLDTRWNGHLSAIVAILSNYTEIADALQKLGSNQLNQFDGETVVTTVGLAAVVATRDFRFISVMMKRVLELLKPADESLQKRTTDINEAMLLIETCMDQVRNLRHEATFVDISKCCNELVDCEPSAKRRMIATPSRRMDDFVVLEPT